MTQAKLQKFDRKKCEHFNAVLDEILNLVNTNKSFEWHELVAIIRKRFDVKNWVNVRVVLAHARNQGHIYRDDDLHVERYYQGHNA